MSRKSDQVVEILHRLEAAYGRPRRIARFEPMDELVSCILSQHSSDARSFPAFTRMKVKYPEWDDVAKADLADLTDVIRTAGLANQKAQNIKNCLKLIRDFSGEYSLEFLRSMPTLEARRWLLALPGVGPKTASIVLCFSMGRETIPVDTHVFRVSWRLGLIPEEMGEVKAHDALMKVVPADLAFRYHTDLIQHGRVTCRAPIPDCDACLVSDMCRWFKRGGPQKRRAELTRSRKKGFRETRSQKVAT